VTPSQIVRVAVFGSALLCTHWLCHQEDSDAPASEQLNILLSGVHGHAGQSHGDELLGGMITWLLQRLVEPSAQVKFKTLAVMLVLGRQGPPKWFELCAANASMQPALQPLLDFQGVEGEHERAIAGVRKQAADLLAVIAPA
jgi:hypothetical protein